MYFLTNKENLIIAISDNLLKKIGVDDICLVSKAIINDLVKIDEEGKVIKLISQEKSFSFESNIMHSILGELKIYNLKEAISVSKEEKNIEKFSNNKDEEFLKNNTELSIYPADKKEEIKEEATLLETDNLNNVTNLEIEDREEIIPLELKELKIPEIPKEAIEEEEKLEALNIEKKTPTLEIENEKNTQIEIKKEDKEKIDDILLDDSILLEESKSNKAEIPQEESKDKYIKIDNLNYSNESKDEIVLDKKEEKEKDKKSLFSKNIFPWKDKKSSKNITSEDLELKIEDEKKLENEIDNNLNIEEKPISLSLEETKEAEIKEDKEDLLLKVEENKNESINDKYLQLEKELLEDEAKDLEKEKDLNKYPIEEEQLEEEEKENKVIEKENENIVEKIIEIQIDNINLEENAKKLNLDIDSYKMLIKSYIDEIKSYTSQLEDGDRDIIEMLSDAGQLLSLNSIILKLKKLTDNKEENREILNEINIFIELLNKKLNQKEKVKESENKENIEFENANESEEEKNLEVETEKEKSPEYIIDLDKAENLLNELKGEKIELNFNKTSKELNLPKDLIEEFTKDFNKQAKEHLDILIDAYKKEDLDKIQTIAHMLKGAANNLRLTEIANNLLKMQEEKDIKNMPDLIKKFASQIKGLDEELNRGE